MAGRVVVGFDGSPAAEAAVRWSADEARLRGDELVVCVVVEPTMPYLFEHSNSDIEGLAAGYPVTVRRPHGHAAHELVAASADAELLIVGSRGRNPLLGLLLGSVSRACLAHAACPVVVVRPQADTRPRHGVVAVGVDTSAESLRALHLAAKEARHRGAALEVVHAVNWENVGMGLSRPTDEQLIRWGHTFVTELLQENHVEGEPAVVTGQAQDALVDSSGHADLLVLGSRGRRALAGALLGSTSDHCASHASCPVMICHPRGRLDADEAMTLDSANR